MDLLAIEFFVVIGRLYYTIIFQYIINEIHRKVDLSIQKWFIAKHISLTKPKVSTDCRLANKRTKHI